MRLALVSFLAVLVAAPLAAQAAQPPARWAVTLNGQVTASYSYARSSQQEDCFITRLGGERREVVFRSQSPSVMTVARARGRADYRPSTVARVRVTSTVGGRRWSESRRCRAAPLETSTGTCAPIHGRSRLLRLGFRWAGANRIWFRPSAGPTFANTMCGLDRAVLSKGWLDAAIGRVDEEALLSGRSRRVIARGRLTKTSNVVSDQDLVVGEELTVRWTLTFRRLP